MNWYKTALKEYEKLKDGEQYWGTGWPKPKPSDHIIQDRWVPVDSSFITHVAYHESLMIFEVRLKNG